MPDPNALDVERLNAEFAVPGAVDFALRSCGPVAVLSAAGSSAVVALQGAQVLSFVPKGAGEVLWLSPLARLASGKAVRGGIPVCWPWFANEAGPGRPAHGFVRTAMWRVLETRAHDDVAQIRLGFDATGIDPALWPHRAELTLAVELAASLKITLTTTNSSAAAITLTEALHTYFAISDISDISISGLESRAYIDKLDLAAKPVQTGAITFAAETDRIYYGTTADTAVIRDVRWGRAIHVGKSGSDSTVVWNPWIEKSERLGDMGPEGYRRMVCVETCNAGPDVVTLAPGARHSLVQELSVSPLDGA